MDQVEQRCENHGKDDSTERSPDRFVRADLWPKFPFAEFPADEIGAAVRRPNVEQDKEKCFQADESHLYDVLE